MKHRQAPWSPPPARGRFSALRGNAWVVLLLVLATIPGCHRSSPSASLAPRFRNTSLEVKYVGDAVCASCHPDQAESYGLHPMGRSLEPVSRLVEQAHGVKETLGTFERDGFRFTIARQAGKMVHRESRLSPGGQTVTELAVPIDYAIGSGTRGRTFLIDRDGYLFQSPVSWFQEKKTWDLTPSFQTAEHFDRPAQPDCLFCHADRVRPVTGAINRYEPPTFGQGRIGCERCHGPGALHVEARERGEVQATVDESIVNPSHLEPALRDAVCQQCHLQGETRVVRREQSLFNYRPGLPLSDYVSVFIRPGEFTNQYKTGSHPLQMVARP